VEKWSEFKEFSWAEGKARNVPASSRNQHISSAVEAGIGIEPIFTDLQSGA
jgi:hypothetical protein